MDRRKGIQLCRRDTDRASSSIAGSGRGSPSHPPSAGSNGRHPAHVSAHEATRWRRPAEGGEARCVAALAAPHPDCPSPTRGPRPARGPRPQRMGERPQPTSREEEPAAGTRRAGWAPRRPVLQLCAPPVFNARLYGVRGAAVARRRPQRGTAGETSASGGCCIPRRICALCLADPRVLSASGLTRRLVRVPTGSELARVR
uniref:Uncharacterized protein n=1 Tax=Setaria viridis TaxID=4556 RepID=A0A4V6D8L5_SETVI|nr:hypothetical protein SEVIR_4G235000v2 [Setaria viridis]